MAIATTVKNVICAITFPPNNSNVDLDVLRIASRNKMSRTFGTLSNQFDLRKGTPFSIVGNDLVPSFYVAIV